MKSSDLSHLVHLECPARSGVARVQKVPLAVVMAKRLEGPYLGGKWSRRWKKIKAVGGIRGLCGVRDLHRICTKSFICVQIATSACICLHFGLEEKTLVEVLGRTRSVRQLLGLKAGARGGI